VPGRKRQTGAQAFSDYVMFNAPAFEMEYAGITGAGGTVQLLDAAIRREIGSDQP